jgi:hypothetical protein
MAASSSMTAILRCSIGLSVGDRCGGVFAV